MIRISIIVLWLLCIGLCFTPSIVDAASLRITPSSVTVRFDPDTPSEVVQFLAIGYEGSLTIRSENMPVIITPSFLIVNNMSSFQIMLKNMDLTDKSYDGSIVFTSQGGSQTVKCRMIVANANPSFVPSVISSISSPSSSSVDGTWRGMWTAFSFYSPKDMVMLDDKSYECISSVGEGESPSSDSSHWKLISYEKISTILSSATPPELPPESKIFSRRIVKPKTSNFWGSVPSFWSDNFLIIIVIIILVILVILLIVYFLRR